MRISSPGAILRVAFMNTFCFVSMLSFALWAAPLTVGNRLFALQPSKQACRQSAGLKSTMSLAREAGPLLMRQYCWSAYTILSSESKTELSEFFVVTTDPQYSATSSPLLNSLLAKRPSPALGRGEGAIFSFSISESGKSQSSCSSSLSMRIIFVMEGESDVSKQQAEAFFEGQFEDPFNTVCYECGRRTRQWVDVRLAIYLCLNCSSLYRQASPLITIKCITADPWTPEELRFLKFGGNRKMREFLSNYDMQELIYRQRLRTKAVDYYRTMLSEESAGRAPPMAPDAIAGLEFVDQEKKLGEMSADQIMEQAKTKAFFVGNAAKEYGSLAFTTVSDKITSGQLKEGAIKTAEEIGTKAKGLWEKLVLKVQNLTG